MKKRIFYILLVFTVVSFCVRANAEELTATLGGIVGEVEVVKAGEEKPIPARDGMTLNVGDTIKTGGGSFVIVTFLPDTFIEVASDSALKITRHELSDTTSALNTKVDILSVKLPENAFY